MHSSKLQRMIVIPPEVFDKWKHIITEDTKLSDLDKRMKTILFDKNINDINKWHQYRENLLKYSFIQKGSLKTSHAMPPITSEKSIQTNLIVKKNKEVETDKPELLIPVLEKQELKRVSEPESLKKNTEKFNNDEIFYDSEPLCDDVNDNHDEECEMDYDDDMRKTALEGTSKNVRIIRVRRSTDPQEYRTYELSNGEVVSVPSPPTSGLKRGKSEKKSQSTLPHSRKQKKHATRSQTRIESKNKEQSWDQYEN